MHVNYRNNLEKIRHNSSIQSLCMCIYVNVHYYFVIYNVKVSRCAICGASPGADNGNKGFAHHNHWS